MTYGGYLLTDLFGGTKASLYVPHISAPEFPWYVLRVRSKCEAAACQILESNGYTSYVPLYRSRRQWSDRIKEFENALFPGYAFCRFNPREKLPILMTPGIAGILESAAGPIAVNESEIESIRIMVQSGLQVGPWPFLHAGQTVLVEHGPLSGVEGRIVSVKNSYRLVVSVSLLQRSVCAEIDRAWVRPVAA